MIVIENVEMPKSCAQCWFSKGVFCAIRNDDDDWVGHHQANKTKPDWCPIIELVQCKDCKWYKEEKGKIGLGCCACLKPAGDGEFICWSNWYCGDGQKKDDSD